MRTSKAKRNIYFVFLFLKAWVGDNWKSSIIIPRIYYHFVGSDEFYQLWKNYADSVGNEHISLGHSVKMYEFFHSA